MPTRGRIAPASTALNIIDSDEVHRPRRVLREPILRVAFLVLLVCVFAGVAVGCGDESSSSGGGSSSESGSSSGAGSRPAEMVGHWRFTDVLMSGEFSLVTDEHLVLNADGTCRTWTKHGSGGGDPESEGVWKLDGDRLYLSPPGGEAWQDAGRATVDGDRMRMILPNGRIQVFERL